MRIRKAAVTCIAAVMGAAVVGAVTTSLIMNFKMNRTINEVKTLTAELKTEKDKTDKNENGEILIGGEYAIRDYSRISDAYISGDSSGLTDETDKEILQLASELLEEIIKDDMSGYEKELAVHDWIAGNVSFDGDSLMAIPAASQYADSPYGALKYKNAVCVGYASTFKLLTNMLGFECEIIYDTELSHSWNVIKLDDGEFYLVDVTFDAGENGNFTHQNFNLSEDAFSMSHDWEVKEFPRAFGTKYSYAAMNKEEISDVYKLAERISDCLDEQETELYFSVEGTDDVTVMYVVQMISERCEMNSDNYIELTQAVGGEDPVYAVNFMYSDEMIDRPEELEGVDEDKLTKLLDDLFGETGYDEYGDL